MKYLWGVKSATRLVWYARHELYHVLIGIVYAWVLREAWGVFDVRQILWSIFGSLLPDVDHLIYFFFYGRADVYSQQVKAILRQGGLAKVSYFLAHQHKKNTNLWSHNIFVISFLFVFAYVSSLYDWRLGLILFGAMILHYLFDITEDLVLLRALNPNWKRWGRARISRRSGRDLDADAYDRHSD